MNRKIVFIILGIGIFLRFLIASLGYTFDFESYKIVAEIVLSGGNVYAETYRYNYGPIWSLCLGFFYSIAQLFPDSFFVFRFIVVGFLTSVDIGIWYIIYKKFSLKASSLFFLSPISIIVTGYYNQFENFALLIAFVAAILLKRNFILGTILFGFSLMTKHIFFAIPLWFIFHKISWKKKLLLVILPLFLFFSGFIPFLPEGATGIISNVFMYRSFNNAPFWQQFIPDYLKRYIIKELLFLGSLFIGGIFFRKKEIFEKVFFYSIILVIFSSAIADQYFSIVVPFISIYFNIFFLLFTIVQTMFFFMVILGGEVNWFGFLLTRQNFSFSLQVFLLFCGLLFVIYRKKFPIFSFRHFIVLLIVLNIFIYIFLVFPAYLEDKKIKPIQKAINLGDYELANTLYSSIERNPPFAGSRFWHKLSSIRYSIEYYRSFMHINDLYEKKQKLDPYEVEKKLKFTPPNFPYKERVQEIKESLYAIQ